MRKFDGQLDRGEMSADAAASGLRVRVRHSGMAAVVSRARTSVVVVRSESDVLRLAGVLLGDRHMPVIVLTEALESDLAVVPPGAVRAAIGPDTEIYLVTGESLLSTLRQTLGGTLGVARGMVRIFWPGLSDRSDPSDHPLVPVLDGEPVDDVLLELAREFNLSRPDVRHEIRLIEDARSVLEQQVVQLERDMRNMAHDIHTANRQRDDALGRPPDSRDSGE